MGVEQMEIYEIKEKVAAVCEDFTAALPLEADQILPEDWDGLAAHFAELASIVASNANRIAAYAAIARRYANRAA